MSRSSLREVRNPLLALKSAKDLQAIPAPHRALLAALLRELQADCRRRADHAWRTGKAPMAVYWKAVGVYAGHLARVLA